jgi:pyocin large subunit-like protein
VFQAKPGQAKALAEIFKKAGPAIQASGVAQSVRVLTDASADFWTVVTESEVPDLDQRRLNEHFEKHGAEFGRITRQDYLRQAQLLRDAKVGGPVLELVRRDGVVTRYDQQTGAFIAFNSNGVIRTFFKPNDGERYWRRQAERGE